MERRRRIDIVLKFGSTSVGVELIQRVAERVPDEKSRALLGVWRYLPWGGQLFCGLPPGNHRVPSDMGKPACGYPQGNRYPCLFHGTQRNSRMQAASAEPPPEGLTH